MVLHSTLTGNDLHEPKGITTALIDTVYIANGSGGGVWSKIGDGVIATATLQDINEIQYTVVLTDVSTASFILIPIPVASTFNSARLVLGAAITIADSTVTFTNSALGSCGTKLITFTGSGEGTSFSFTPTGNAVFSANTYLKIASDGASTTTAPLYMTITFTRT